MKTAINTVKYVTHRHMYLTKQRITTLSSPKVYCDNQLNQENITLWKQKQTSA